MAIDLSKLGEIRVLDTAGNPISLASFWLTGPAVLVWLRQFGCSFCQAQTGHLMGALPDLEAAGGRLVLIGNGSPDQALRFQHTRAAGVTVVTDPERSSYRMVGAHRSLWGLVGPPDLAVWWQGRRMGIRQQQRGGDRLHLGATLVVAPPRQLRFCHVNSSLGDQPRTAELVQALVLSQADHPAASLSGAN